jgi:uncharacterized membrane protein SpoIIM required for sporulation
MKESHFVRSNKEKWERFEAMQGSNNSDPEELSNLYLDITDDLGFAQTYYQRRSIRIYLNQLAQKVLIGVNRYQKQSFKSFLNFWTVDLPIEIYKARRSLRFAFLCFLGYAVLGWISSEIYPEFIASILGQDYVDLTVKNIEKGNPLAIYEGSTQMQMFLTITTNNLMISILLFASGILMTVFTQYFLLQNGIMLGAFQNMFYQKGLFITSFLGIWIHGAFEISCIVLAGGAGITAGSGWIFPGGYTRGQAFRAAFTRGAKIMLSLLPFIVLAGYLESYVTRHNDTLPDISKLLIICFSFAIVLFLFVLLPQIQARRHPEKLAEEDLIPQPNESKIILLKIRNIGVIFRESFVFFFSLLGTYLQKVFKWLFPTALGFIYLRAYLFPEDMSYVYFFDWSSQLSFMLGYSLHNALDPLLIFFWMFAISITFLFINHQFLNKGEMAPPPFKAYLKKVFFRTFLAVCLLLLPIFALPWYVILPYLFILPFFCYLPPAAANPTITFKEARKKGFNLGFRSYLFILMGVFLSTFAVAVLVQPFAFVFSINDGVPDLLDHMVRILSVFIEKTGEDTVFWGNVLRQFVYCLLVFFAVVFWSVYVCVAYFSTLEKHEAIQLQRELPKFGNRNRMKENMETDA